MLRTLVNIKDVLNIFHIINKAFYEKAAIVYNPRNAMYISKIDGKLNTAMMVQRDTIINSNTLMHLGKHVNTQSNLDKIAAIKQRQKEYWISESIAI